MIFRNISHVPVSACVECEGRSKRICVSRVYNTLFLAWKGRYYCMVFCMFIKIAALI